MRRILSTVFVTLIAIVLVGSVGCKKGTPQPNLKKGDLVDPFPPNIRDGALVDPFAGAAAQSSFALQAPDPAANMYTCHCECSDGGSSGAVAADLHVCVKEEDNETSLSYDGTPVDVATDCAGRVETTLEGLAGACNYPSDCTCSSGATPVFNAECDVPCTEKPVRSDCSNFNPETGITNSTNVAGDEPVCTGLLTLASAIFGRRTTCLIDGSVHVEIGGESRDTTASGIVDFKADPCPGESCQVGMEYHLELAPVTFGNVFNQETFNDLATVGRGIPGQETTVSPTGDATFGYQTTASTARGQRGSDRQAYLAFNEDDVAVEIKWADPAPTCALDGALIGTADPELKRCESAGPDADEICSNDDDCTDVPECSDGTCECEELEDTAITADFDLQGEILNQPPFADAGTTQTVECEETSATDVTLDGSDSDDADQNITLYGWFRGSRTGTKVGSDAVTTIQQPLGTETYVLRVIDGFAQADEDSTSVTVADTTPPTVRCSLSRDVLRAPTHKLRNAGLTALAVDTCAGSRSVGLSVFSDEAPDSRTGDGVTLPDALIDRGQLQLRAERKGDSDGRVYLVVASASDPSGNASYGCCTAVVPRGVSSAEVASVEAQAAAAQAYCVATGQAPPVFYVIGSGSAPAARGRRHVLVPSRRCEGACCAANAAVLPADAYADAYCRFEDLSFGCDPNACPAATVRRWYRTLSRLDSVLTKSWRQTQRGDFAGAIATLSGAQRRTAELENRVAESCPVASACVTERLDALMAAFDQVARTLTER